MSIDTTLFLWIILLAVYFIAIVVIINNSDKRKDMRRISILALEAMNNQHRKEEVMRKLRAKEKAEEPLIPEKSYFHGELVNYHCPKCGEALGYRVHKRWTNFCPVCGQPLKWDE